MTVRTELRLLALARPYRGLLLLGLTAAFFGSVLDGVTVVTLIPLLRHLFGTAGALHAGSTRLETFVEEATRPLLEGAGRDEATLRLVAVLAAGLLLKNVCTYAATQIAVRVQEGLVANLRARLFRHLLALDLAFFQRARAGHLISTITTEVDQAKGVVTVSLISFFQNLVMVAATLLIMSQLSLRLTLLTLVCVPPLILGVQALLRRLRRHARARTEERSQITAALTEKIGAIRLIRAFDTRAREADRFATQADRYRKRVIRTQRFSSLTGPVSEVFAGLLVVLVIWAGTHPEVVGGAALAPEAIVVFLMATLRMTSPLKTLTQFPTALTLVLASVERVFALLDEPEADVDGAGAGVATFARDVVYENVSYRYPAGAEALRDVSFRLAKGSVLAVVGPSGGGKSTLADLLPRLIEPTGGRILLDGVPLATRSRSSVRALVGVVGQETVLLHDTAHANIAYAVPDATRAQVEAAARAANAAGFIERLPQGYDTVLGERGSRLSGGQRQRLAIARALLKDPPILLLDEATSALDAEAERLVQEAIERLMRDRTVLVIAHRLATVRNADAILVLDEGRVVQRGTHATLLHERGVYRRLFESQFRDPAGSLSS